MVGIPSSVRFAAGAAALALVASGCGTSTPHRPQGSAATHPETFTAQQVRTTFARLGIRLFDAATEPPPHHFVALDRRTGKTLGGDVLVLHSTRAAREASRGWKAFSAAGLWATYRRNVVVEMSPPWTSAQRARLVRGLQALR